MNERKKYYKELKGTQKVLRKKDRFVELFKNLHENSKNKTPSKDDCCHYNDYQAMVTPTPNIQPTNQPTKQTDKQPSKKKHNDNIKI